MAHQHWLELRGADGSDAGLQSSTYEIVTVPGSRFSREANVFAACSESRNSSQRASGWPVGPSLLLCCCYRSPSTAEPWAKRPRSPQPLQAKLPTAPRAKMTQATGDWIRSGGALSQSAATLTRCWSWWAGVMECVNTAVATVGLFWLQNSLLGPIWSSLLENERFSVIPFQRGTWIPVCYHVGDSLTQSSQSIYANETWPLGLKHKCSLEST